MTLWVTRDGSAVTVHGNVNLDVRVQNSQVQEFGVTEHYMHLRHFWNQLGQHLDEAEKEAADAVATEG
jgi:hypothetical protein